MHAGLKLMWNEFNVSTFYSLNQSGRVECDLTVLLESSPVVGEESVKSGGQLA